MKVIGVVGSPRKKGNTSRAVGWVLESAQEQGAEVEMVALSDLNIGYCKGCNRCFIEGECPQEDDLGQLHRKMIESDGIVFGAPSFVMHVPAQTKTFIDRSAFMCHRPQLMGKPCVSVSLSSAGIGQDTVAEYLNSVLHAMGATPVGALTTIAYGPGIFPEEKQARQEAWRLGAKLVEAIKEEETTHRMAQSYSPTPYMRQIMSRMGRYLKADYQFWEQRGWLEGLEMEEGKKARPLTESCKELIQHMPTVFRPERAKGMDAVVQFIVTGEEEFQGYLEIKDQKCAYHEGMAENPTVTVITPADIWLKVSRGEMSGTWAFMTRKYKVKGNWRILSKFNKLFG